ncbi:MAG: hypothetical protein QM813_22755 [Verrucomicrobiota bacterium]
MHSFTPMFAEIADKMPTLDTMWTVWLVIGLIAVAITTAFSLARLWLGGIAVLACFALGMMAAWPESMDAQVVRELGVGYLWQQRISGFVPCVLAVASWIIVWLIRRPNHALQRTAAPLSVLCF